jgi:ATP-dependent helicase YprA (DUF1998 family)
MRWRIAKHLHEHLLAKKPTRLKSHSKTLGQVFASLREKYSSTMIPKAIRIFTPFPQKYPIAGLKLSSEAIRFITAYEPRAGAEGLYGHQYKLLQSYVDNKADNFILSSSTGSGKSLCFWTWVIDQLTKNKKATALLCFPTQALMWGQAERLAGISKEGSLIYGDTRSLIAYAGSLKFGENKGIGWTIWKGIGRGQTADNAMKRHESSDEFKDARIRIATIDKAHYSLIQGSPDFTRRLSCIVLDEAHQYDGIFGANVHFFLKRLYVARAAAHGHRPFIFLASATLSDAENFASRLTSMEKENIHHEADAATPVIQETTLDEAELALSKPPAGGMTRIVIMVDSSEADVNFDELLSDGETIGDSVNMLYFSKSKVASRMAKLNAGKGITTLRNMVVYDADLPPLERRKIESEFNNRNIKGGTIIATNALELGVDIDNLDICVINATPAKRVDFYQRIGRVGRREDRPGLVIINLSASPADRAIAEDPTQAFSFDTTRTIPLPTHLELLTLKHMCGAHYEGCFRLYANGKWDHYVRVFKSVFGEFKDEHTAKRELESRYPGLIDTSDIHFVHHGFRAGAGDVKIPLRVLDADGKDIAWINKTDLFRAAHPEAIYLDANMQYWRIVEYGSNGNPAALGSRPRNALPENYLEMVNVVYIKEQKKRLTTRAKYEESYDSRQMFADPPTGVAYPENGKFEFGIWEYRKEFKGYYEHNLSTRKVTYVPMEEIGKRFKSVQEAGGNFPSPFRLSYRTYGWCWDFSGALAEDDTDLLIKEEMLITEIMRQYLADSVQSNVSDLEVSLSLTKSNLRVLDSTPAGNGLSEALIRDDRFNRALENCMKNFSKFCAPIKKGNFNNFLFQLCGLRTTREPEEIIGIIKNIKGYWAGVAS